MSKITTAEEFLDKKFPKFEDLDNDNIWVNIEKTIIEFAKMHVEAALTEASKTTKWKEQITTQGLHQVTIIKSSILNAYPLENIK